MNYRSRPTTPFEAYLMETRRIQLGTARQIASALKGLVRYAGVEEVLTGDLDAIVESHPRVVKARAERRRPCKHRHALADAGRAFRAFVEAGGEVPR